MFRNRKALLLCGFILFGAAFFALGSGKLMAEESGAASQADAAKNQELINKKLDEIKQIQAEIAKHQADVKAKQKEGKSLKNEIAIYDGNIRKNQLEIEETKATIEKTDLEIEAAKSRMQEDDKNIAANRAALKDLIRELYSYQQSSMLEILIENHNLSDFFNEVGSMESVQSKLYRTVNELRQEKKDLAVKNEELEAKQVEYQSLVNIRYEQNGSLENLKSQKDEILKITNGEEGKFQALVAQNQSLLPSLRAEIRNLQSLGTSISFNDAISAAKYAGSVTGVRPALLLAILRVESGLGTNVGGGRYATDMNPSQRPVFEAITQELGYDPNVMPCSKKSASYGNWGGAIGPAQMIPSTWQSIKAEVAQIVKKNPPDPWNLTDSIAAIAIKLSKVNGVTSGNRDAEYQAAGIYLAGVNWQKFPFYPNKVMYYADLYEKELNGQ